MMVGCTPKPAEVKSIQGEVFGSYYIVKYVGDLDRDELKKELNQFFKNFNDSFSTYQKDSVISVFNMSKANEKLIVSKEFIELLKVAKNLFDQTQGAFDPTLGPVIKAWGFGGSTERKVPSQKILNEARALVGFDYIKWDEQEASIWKTKDGVQLDVNAFAPGYAADLMGKILEKHKVNNFMVDISGEFVVRGDKGDGNKWIIGIEKPSANYAEGVQQILTVTNESIATSGDYRQFYNEKGEKLSHIIDPRTGHPVNNGIASASVITSNGAMADGWATAMMILGEEGISLAQKYGVKVFLLKTKSKDQYEEIITDDFKAHLIQAK